MKKWKTLVWAFCFAWRLDKRMLLACFGINAVISVMPAAVLHYNQQVIAGITEFAGRGNGTFEEIAGGIIALGLAMTVYGLSNRINGDLLYMVMYDSYYLGMEEALMEKIQRIPYKVLKQRKTQEEYIAVINRAGSLTDLTSALCVLSGRILTAVSLLLVVIRQSVWSFWIVLIYIVVSAAVSSRYIDRQRVNMLEVRKNENVAAYFQNLPLNPGVAKEIRIYDTYRDILKQWGQAFENIEKQERTYAWGKESQSFRNGMGLYVFMALLCVFQIFQIAGGRMTVDAFLTIFLLCQNLSGTVRDITGSMISLDYGLFSLERQKRFLQEMPEMNAPEESQRKFRETTQVPAGECLVQLRDVSFGYEEKIILKNIRLDVKKGEVIALLGRNGSGKSTLAKVIAGQLWPDEGELFFQGCPYQKENMESIRKKIGIYFQDFFLFHMTLKENIQIGSIDCTDSEELERVLTLGDVRGILKKLPQGADQMLKKDVDKNGAVLSGGEQQKVGVARAFYGDKELLIFDEPAAALDPIAEIRQFENIRASVKDRAAILISHRIGFARLADRIVVLQDGEIAEQGTHEELMERQGAYYELFLQQAQWYQE